MFVVKLARMYTLNAINIQRVARGHIARKGEVRVILEANHAARVITKALRTYVANKVKEGGGNIVFQNEQDLIDLHMKHNVVYCGDRGSLCRKLLTRMLGMP